MGKDKDASSCIPARRQASMSRPRLPPTDSARFSSRNSCPNIRVRRARDRWRSATISSRDRRRSDLACKATSREEGGSSFRCFKMEKDLTASYTGLRSYSSPHPSLLLPRGWRIRVAGSWVAYILRAAFISIRRGFDPPSKPNLRSISRANTLRERDEPGDPADSPPFPFFSS
jgi:hypothetical protein